MDSQGCKLVAEGKFEFRGVPAESVSLAVRINGNRFSKRYPSLDWLNGRILSRATCNVNDFISCWSRATGSSTTRPTGLVATTIRPSTSRCKA